jgi:hypothetical protein
VGELGGVLGRVNEANRAKGGNGGEKQSAKGPHCKGPKKSGRRAADGGQQDNAATQRIVHLGHFLVLSCKAAAFDSPVREHWVDAGRVN